MSAPVALASPVAETARLRLRAPRMDDAAVCAALGASPRAKGVGGPSTEAQGFRRRPGPAALSGRAA